MEITAAGGGSVATTPSGLVVLLTSALDDVTAPCTATIRVETEAFVSAVHIKLAVDSAGGTSTEPDDFWLIVESCVKDSLSQFVIVREHYFIPIHVVPERIADALDEVLGFVSGRDIMHGDVPGCMMWRCSFRRV